MVVFLNLRPDVFGFSVRKKPNEIIKKTEFIRY